MCECEECDLEAARPADYIQRARRLGLPVKYLQARADLAAYNGNEEKASNYRREAGQLKW